MTLGGGDASARPGVGGGGGYDVCRSNRRRSATSFGYRRRMFVFEGASIELFMAFEQWAAVWHSGGTRATLRGLGLGTASRNGVAEMDTARKLARARTKGIK